MDTLKPYSLKGSGKLWNRALAPGVTRCLKGEQKELCSSSNSASHSGKAWHKQLNHSRLTSPQQLIEETYSLP